MRILLISANPEAQPYPVFPLGLSRLAASLRARGQAVRIYDLLAHGRTGLPAALQEFQPGLIGLSLRNVDNIECLNQRTYLADYCALVRTLRAHGPQAPLVLGGPAYAIFPERWLDLLQADVGIAGPAEEPLCDLVQALEQGRPLETVAGIRLRQPGRILFTGPRPQSAAPAADWEREPDLTRYYWEQGGSLNAQTQLGCSHACVYCTYALIDGPGCRVLGAGESARGLKRLADEQNITHVFIVDSVFNLNPGHALDFARALIRLGSPVSWTCFCEPGPGPDGFLEVLAEAGCTHVEFGTDSLSDPVLAAYGKPFRFADVLRWNRAAARARIHQAHFLIPGGPGETWDTLQETFARSRELKPAVFFPFAGMRIYPHTPLALLALAQGLIRAEDDLIEPVFFFSPATPQERLLPLLEAQAQQDDRWILPAAWQQTRAVRQRLRARGKKGPLWEYLEK